MTEAMKSIQLEMSECQNTETDLVEIREKCARLETELFDVRAKLALQTEDNAKQVRWVTHTHVGPRACSAGVAIMIFSVHLFHRPIWS